MSQFIFIIFNIKKGNEHCPWFMHTRNLMCFKNLIFDEILHLHIYVLYLKSYDNCEGCSCYSIVKYV